ncbi:MAG: hypothetical protein CMN72_09710 [Sphingomonas sp.]|uniref:Uncharacterized protein n=1 Tax=Stakelama marina TaxID=2826939 RepID=A0A8T4IK54_9SPHN|nr:hypothetical protein [Stakelama marina]MAW99906.1 hypothetical protein [Sphingomonas sp.]MBR0552729.1 hypothetical protein [Stakelama marina]
MTAPAPSPDPGALPAFATEPTAIGPQSLVPGVTPIHPRDRLAWRAAAPMEAKKPQRPCNHGLFDLNARNQFDLFTPPPPSRDTADRRSLPAIPSKESSR